MNRRNTALGLAAVTVIAVGYEASERYGKPGPSQREINDSARECEINYSELIVTEQANLDPKEAAERRAAYGTDKMHLQIQRDCTAKARRDLGAPPSFGEDMRHNGAVALMRILNLFGHPAQPTPAQQQAARADFVKTCKEAAAKDSARIVAEDPAKKTSEAGFLPLEQTRCEYKGKEIYPIRLTYGPFKPN